MPILHFLPVPGATPKGGTKILITTQPTEVEAKFKVPATLTRERTVSLPLPSALPTRQVQVQSTASMPLPGTILREQVQINARAIGIRATRTPAEPVAATTTPGATDFTRTTQSGGSSSGGGGGSTFTRETSYTAGGGGGGAPGSVAPEWMTEPQPESPAAAKRGGGLGLALAGAAGGFMVGNVYGAVIGGVLGFVLGDRK